MNLSSWLKNTFNKKNVQPLPADKATASPAVLENSGVSGLKTTFKEKRVFILVILTILILSATSFRQLIIDCLKLIQDNKAGQKQLTLLTAKANYLGNLDPNQLEKRVRELEQVFPSKKPALEFINAINLLAIEEGVALSAITLNPGKLESNDAALAKTEGTSGAKNTVENFLLNFNVEGPMDKLGKFIKDLEKTAPLTKIENLGILLGEGQEGSRILKIGLSARVYYQSMPKSLPAVETAIEHLTAEEEAVLDSLSTFKFFPLEGAYTATASAGKDDLFMKPL